jgi:hypothetical protein
MAWMTAEAVVAITAGVLGSSIALTGSGLDSVIEFAAAAIAVWQLCGEGEERETRGVRLIGVTFFVLAVYLAIEGDFPRAIFTWRSPTPLRSARRTPLPASRWAKMTMMLRSAISLVIALLILARVVNVLR